MSLREREEIQEMSWGGCMNLKETYNKIAEDWYKDHLDEWWVPGADKFLSFLNKGDRILDAGCGPGIKSGFFVDRGFRAHGVDFSESMIKIAKRDFPQAEFSVLDLNEAEKLKDMYNAIFLQAVLLHFSKYRAQEILKKLATKLKSGGFFHVSVKEVGENQPEEQVRVENDYGYEYERFFSYYTTEEIEGYLRNLGFDIVHTDMTSWGKTNWIQVIGMKK